MQQISLFGGEEPLKINKKIRLIELFAGIGAQAKALENIGADFEHYRICEFDKYAVASYNAIHGTDFKTSDITKIHASDLSITEKDKYEYIMSYSFPCQSLSVAGKGAGMAKGSGTRSGLLWEVERLLEECGDNLPQILLMENVDAILFEKNRKHFFQWCNRLEEFGYKNYYQVLNAKDYGIPQNRNRCFMVSVLGDYYFEFPKPIKLELCVKDMLEKEVPEKYYISNERVTQLLSKEWGGKTAELPINENPTINYALGSRESLAGFKEICPCLAARDYKDPKILCQPCLTPGRFEKRQNGRRLKEDGEPMFTLTAQDIHGVAILQPTRTDYGKAVRKQYEAGEIKESRHNMTKLEPRTDGISNTLTTIQKDNLLMVPREKPEYKYRIRKLMPIECYKLQGFTREDFFKVKKAGISDSQCYKQAGNSIVVDVLEAIFRNMNIKGVKRWQE